MAEKNRYSDAELQEFKEIILAKLEKARENYAALRASVSGGRSNQHKRGGWTSCTKSREIYFTS